MVVLDTTILIDLLKDEKEAVNKFKKLEKENEELLTTQINVFELIQGVYKQKNNVQKRISAIDMLLQKIKILDITFISSFTSGKISGELRKKGLQISPSDVLIAGTAIANNEKTIVTRNTKDFKKIPEIKVETY